MLSFFLLLRAVSLERGKVRIRSIPFHCCFCAEVTIDIPLLPRRQATATAPRALQTRALQTRALKGIGGEAKEMTAARRIKIRQTERRNCRPNGEK